MDKEVLRDKYLKIRKSISKEDKAKYDNEIFNKLINLQEYKNSKLILTYVSLENEVDTFRIIEYSLKVGKKVSVPKCEVDIIKFYYISSIDELEQGHFGILEPISNDIVSNFEESICIIPGVCFDKKMNRIGYGKGYYDRFLKDYTGFKIGLTYKECICDKIIDADKYDIKVDMIL